MDERTLGLLDTLGRALLWGAVAVVGLAVISAVAIAGSETTIPGLDEIQRENRGVVSVIALGSGITGAGLLAGLGAIVRLLVAGRREAQEQGK